MVAPHGQADPEFRPDECLETLLRIRRDQPRRYAREVSAGQRRRVELYEQRKARAAAAGEGGMRATLVEDEELQRLRAQAEGTHPFLRSALWEWLSALDLKEFWKLPARERLAVSYYQTARRRAESLLTDDAPGALA